ncbi:hypothetical protein [Muricoccus aerilatus]|uniref:hypothetical protein n=1 Tax=Muricoccus aerilatus TaxID=452982 RepID=UPI0005C20408|nr:hypothetical protein [Roseomonas aerilata]
MPDWLAPLVPALVEYVATPLILALGGYLVTLLPGPLRTSLQASSHSKDMALILGAMTRKATERIMSGASAKALPGLIVSDVVAYAEANLPEVMGKLAPSQDALQTMAAAAIADAMSRLTKPSLPPTPSNLGQG